MKLNHYKIGWIGIRASRIGKASQLLTRDGWWKAGHADLNNRNAFDFAIPTMTKEQFGAMDWTRFANAGLVGLAFWITDAQWGKNASITDKQWTERAIIEKAFNAQWPNGRRNS